MRGWGADRSGTWRGIGGSIFPGSSTVCVVAVAGFESRLLLQTLHVSFVHAIQPALQVGKGAWSGTPASWAVLATPSKPFVALTSCSPHAFTTYRQRGVPRPWTCSKRAGPFTCRTTRSTNQPMRCCCAACMASSQACCSCTTACACTGRCCRCGKCETCGCVGEWGDMGGRPLFCCRCQAQVPRRDRKAYAHASALGALCLC